MNNEKRVLTVNEVNECIKGIIEGIPFFSSLAVDGEISNWKRYRSGVFFDLKGEDDSLLSCTIWNDALSSLSFLPQDGDRVIARGRISVYAKRGRYSLSISSLEKKGLGSALLALEELKKKLAKEGLFDESKKRPIPSFPTAVGIICGANSAAESDLLRNLSRRWPLLEIYVFHAIVQGEKAPNSLLKALEDAEKSPIDTLILARGGGSSEDLSAFNDEGVVRKFAAFPKPTISAVGHEIDVTLVDYVSDLRVSTPTGAAEKATPDIEEIKETLLNDEKRTITAIKKTLLLSSERLKNISSRPFFKNPLSPYEEKNRLLIDMEKRLKNGVVAHFSLTENQFDNLSKRLKASSPDAIIARGYGVIMNENGKPLDHVSKIVVGEEFNVLMKGGKIKGRVIEKEERK